MPLAIRHNSAQNAPPFINAVNFPSRLFICVSISNKGGFIVDKVHKKLLHLFFEKVLEKEIALF